MSRGSSFGTVSGYGLDDLGLEVRVRYYHEFSHLHILHSGSGAHSASYSMVTGDSIPGGKEEEA